MAMLNGSLAIAVSVPFIGILAIGCSTGGMRSPPVERPAEITLPATNSVGGLDKIRSDLRAFTNGRPHSRTRPANCNQCIVDVDIHSVGLTRDITPMNGVARFRIVARIKNNDPIDTESKYSLKPGGEYLMWVGPAKLNSAGTSRTVWGLLELPAGSTGPIVPVMIGYVERCLHPYKSTAPTSDADFRDCDTAHAAQSGPTVHGDRVLPAFFSSSNSAPLGLAVAGGTWFDCGGYCCTGTNKQ